MKKTLLLGITGETDEHYREKIEEINERQISVVALFLERFLPHQREEIYGMLENSTVKEIPLVHIRHDIKKEELILLSEKYNTQCFTIHESHFDILSSWEGFEEKLFLEMNTDNVVPDNVEVGRVGGFCVDLAHYQKQEDIKALADYKYVYDRRHDESLFKCNHVSGYSFIEKKDLHYVDSKKDFDYLRFLPIFLFGDIMAIEVDNSIAEQVVYREHILKILTLL
jgi:hypothetical protein